MANQLSFEEWFDRTVRGLPEHKIRQEDKKAEIDPFEEGENGQDYFQRQTICQGCQRLIDPANHQCEGLQPRFYLEDLVDWDECPPHANWAAQDANGVIWFYRAKPFLDAASGRWIGEGDTWYKYSVALAIDWKKPLPRPKEISFYLENLVDFTQLPGWTRYVAQDDNGTLVAYEKEPDEIDVDGKWVFDGPEGRNQDLGKADCLAIDQDKPLKLEKEVKFKPVYND